MTKINSCFYHLPLFQIDVSISSCHFCCGCSSGPSRQREIFSTLEENSLQVYYHHVVFDQPIRGDVPKHEAELLMRYTTFVLKYMTSLTFCRFHYWSFLQIF
jgi:hypothetical protein